MHSPRYVSSSCTFYTVLEHSNDCTFTNHLSAFLHRERNRYRRRYRYRGNLVWNFNLPRVYLNIRSLFPSLSTKVVKALWNFTYHCIIRIIFERMKINFSPLCTKPVDERKKKKKEKIWVQNCVEIIRIRYFDETARDSVLFDDISYAHFVCNSKVIQTEVVRRARIPDGFMGKPL